MIIQLTNIPLFAPVFVGPRDWTMVVFLLAAIASIAYHHCQESLDPEHVARDWSPVAWIDLLFAGAATAAGLWLAYKKVQTCPLQVVAAASLAALAAAAQYGQPFGYELSHSLWHCLLGAAGMVLRI